MEGGALSDCPLTLHIVPSSPSSVSLRGQPAVESCQGQSGCPGIVLALYLLLNDNERVSIIFG